MNDLSPEGLRLVDTPPEATYDNLVELARQTLVTPISLVSIVQVERDRQFFKSHRGLPELIAQRRETPLSHSFCRHVVERDRALVVDDAREHPLVRTNPAVEELGVMAYLGAPIRTPGGTPVGALCVIDVEPRCWAVEDVERLTRLAHCVSEAIRLQASLNASEALRAEQAAFTYALSHELRSPLATAKVLLEELSGEHGPHFEPEDARLLQLGCATLCNADTLLDDVLRYTRTLRTTFEPRPVALDVLLQNVFDTLRHDIAHSRATFEIGRLPQVNGDAQQLEILIENLISNAIRYARPGVAPRVQVRAQRVGHQMELQLADNGLGLASDHHESVFDLFRRQHAGNSAPGSGLGLTVCRRIATNHHGTIRFDSSPGGGACLSVRLPCSGGPLSLGQAA